MASSAQKLLDRLNAEHVELSRVAEELFWLVRMGDYSLNDKMNEADKARDAFRSDTKNIAEVRAALTMTDTTPAEKEKLKVWENFFKLFQAPPEVVPVRDEIAKLEAKVAEALATAKEGYINPKTGEFTPASKIEMRMMMRTNPDEKIREACFRATEETSTMVLDDYIKIVQLRNKYARMLGYEDFYAYKLSVNEGMTKAQVFKLFDEIYEGTKGTFAKIRELEKTMPGLRKPWNFSYMMSGKFTDEEDKYFNFDEALLRWGRSFSALGIDFKGGTLQLDMLSRQGKYNNGFCHYPMVVNFIGGKRNPAAANFTCNVVYGQVGAGSEGYRTLFHEGGHAADKLNAEETETCLNTEWAPASVAWAETHSQFLEHMLGGIEWKTRYAKDSRGEAYPFELYEKKVRKLRILAPLGLHGIMLVSNFERKMYETENLTPAKVLEIAVEMERKYSDYSVDSPTALSTPHIYAWDTSAYYHAYGLAILALDQWRDYFYKKYGYIVDNPNVGKEMMIVWAPSSSKSFGEFVKMAMGEELSPKAFIEEAVMDADVCIARAKLRLEKMKSVPEYNSPVKINAIIKMVHGKEVIADNSVSFEDMAEKYTEWLHTRK